MRKKSFCLSVVVALVMPATAVSASEWEPEREYSEFAVAPSDEVRYGGYTVGDRGYIDVLDPSGNVTKTIQLPTPNGSRSMLHDLDTSGDLLIASYEVSPIGGNPFFDPGFFSGLSLYRDGDEIASGSRGGHPYGSTSEVALTDSWAFVDFVDSGSYGWIYGYPLEGIPAVESDGAEPIEGGIQIADWEYPRTYIAASDDELFLYRSFEGSGTIDVYSLPPGSELIETVAPEGLNLHVELRDAADGLAGSFVMSGFTDASLEWCGIWTHASDGSFQDCFLPNLGGADQDAEHRIDPFGVDGCGGIVVADVEADAGVLTGHKFIPSIRDPGCFVDSLDSTFVSNIGVVGRSGVTRGCNPPDNDRFCPDEFVTRGQMAAFLHRALDDVLSPTQSVEFIDDDGNTFEADIEWLGGVNVTRGCNPPTNDRYCPDDYVTRGQMAALLVRALGYTDNGGGDLFIDDDNSTFELDIDKLGTAGVTRGCNPPVNDRFCPNDYVTRGQMAAFLDRALNG